MGYSPWGHEKSDMTWRLSIVQASAGGGRIKCGNEHEAVLQILTFH